MIAGLVDRLRLAIEYGQASLQDRAAGRQLGHGQIRESVIGLAREASGQRFLVRSQDVYGEGLSIGETLKWNADLPRQ